MAAQKSAKYPYKWSDGTWHSITEAQHKVNVANKGNKTGTPIVPSGTYDTGLDAQLYASRRGLKDLVGGAYDVKSNTYGGDIGEALTRGYDDWQLGLKDVGTSYDRSLGDLLKSRERGEADYKTSIGNVERGYQNLGINQNAAARKAGVVSGGAIQQAAEKRAANMEIDKAPITTAWQRALDDSKLAETRLGEDRDVAVGKLNVGQTRSVDDLQKQARRAIREGTAFEQDIQAAKVGQFNQNFPGAQLPRAQGATRTYAGGVGTTSKTAGGWNPAFVAALKAGQTTAQAIKTAKKKKLPGW